MYFIEVFLLFNFPCSLMALTVYLGDMEPVRQPAPTRSNKTSKPVNKPPSKPAVKPSPRQPEEDKSGISPEDFLPVNTISFVI